MMQKMQAQVVSSFEWFGFIDHAMINDNETKK